MAFKLSSVTQIQCSKTLQVIIGTEYLSLLEMYVHCFLDAGMSKYISLYSIFTATCFSNVAVMGSLDVRLSVRLSVTLVSSDHILSLIHI